MTASIFFRSALVSFLPLWAVAGVCSFLSGSVRGLSMNNPAYLLIQFILPLQQGIEVIRPVGPLTGPEDAGPDDVSGHLLQGLAVFLIHAQKEKGQHHQHHAHGGGAAPQGPQEKEEQRCSDQHSSTKTNELALGEVEHDLRFHAGQVLGYGDICQKYQASFFTFEWM